MRGHRGLSQLIPEDFGLVNQCYAFWSVPSVVIVLPLSWLHFPGLAEREASVFGRQAELEMRALPVFAIADKGGSLWICLDQGEQVLWAGGSGLPLLRQWWHRSLTGDRPLP